MSEVLIGASNSIMQLTGFETVFTVKYLPVPLRGGGLDLTEKRNFAAAKNGVNGKYTNANAMTDDELWSQGFSQC